MARNKEPTPVSLEEEFPLSSRLPVHKIAPMGAISPSDGLRVELAKLYEIQRLLWLPSKMSEADKNAKLVAAADQFESIKPAEGIEAMLALQMVGTHAAALECLRRAMIPEQTFEGRNAALTQAQRLMSLYTQQMAALDKHRGKGQQKITVERVQVAAGGQAIVGDVHTTKSAVPPQVQQQESLETPREDTVPLEAPLPRTKAAS